MTSAVAAPLGRAQKLAEWTAMIAVVGAVALMLDAVADVGVPSARVLREQVVTPDWQGGLSVIRAIGGFIVLAAPGFLLAWALFDLSGVLDQYGKGRFFTLKASAGVRKAGEGALWALAFKVLISPTVFSWITQEGRGFIWHFEHFDLGLIAFAAFVMVLGRVLEAAARIKEENEQIV